MFIVSLPKLSKMKGPYSIYGAIQCLWWVVQCLTPNRQAMIVCRLTEWRNQWIGLFSERNQSESQPHTQQVRKTLTRGFMHSVVLWVKARENKSAKNQEYCLDPGKQKTKPNEQEKNISSASRTKSTRILCFEVSRSEVENRWHDSELIF